MDDEILRVLVATDNHLGYAERDSIRSNDSFAAFEEVLITARDHDVDFVLLAGDMFHENKPSRRTTHTAMNLLRKHCLGEKPVYTVILNEQSEIFKSNPLGRVNYEDPYQSISLPVFAIHGNHDDTSREGGSGESLAALDLLSVSNLINYFGKAAQVDDIEITPVLMKKGETLVALYGLGAIRDERLNRMWNLKKVKFVRPSEQQGRDRFVNIFVLHQNRDYGRGSKNCVHESMIPQWMDVVIWGNEHECQPRLSESLVGTYRIYQPGSSVCTSLVEGESMLHPKGMGMLEIKLKKFRLLALPFKQIRPFVYGDFSLNSVRGLDPSDPKIEEKIKNLLSDKVKQMIVEAREKSAMVEEAYPDGLQHRILSPFQVLIRLRVEHIGFPTINTQRFGAQFVGEVANPSDLLLFAKKKREEPRCVEGEARRPDATASEMLKIIQEGEEDAIFKINIEDLVNETLCGGNRPLSVLVETEMALALEDFVVKRHVNAINDIVQESLERMQRDLIADQAATGKTGIAEAVSKSKRRAEDAIRNGERRQAKKAVKRTGAVGFESADELDDDRDEGSEEEELVPKKGRVASAAAKKKAPLSAAAIAREKKAAKELAAKKKVIAGKKKRAKSDEDEDGEEEDIDEGDSDGSHEQTSPPRSKSRAKATEKKKPSSRAAVGSSSRGAASGRSEAVSRGTAKTNAQQQIKGRAPNSEDEEDPGSDASNGGDVEDEYVGEDDKSGGDDDDDDDEVQILPSRGKKGRGSSSTNCRSTPKPVEKKNPSSSRTLNIATTTSSSVGKGRGRDAPPQRDDIEDDECWDRPMKKEVRQSKASAPQQVASSSSSSSFPADKRRNDARNGDDPLGGDNEGPPLTGRSASSAYGDSQAISTPMPIPTAAATRVVTKRQLPLSFSQNTQSSSKKAAKHASLSSGWD